MKNFIANLGPGILYAAAAIGVSHLVQSTRAGADFGYQLAIVIVLANFIKYPFFKIGAIYTNSTQKSLLHGYKKLGPFGVPLFIFMTLATMFVIEGAITVVTAGIFSHLIPYSLNIKVLSVIILLICTLILLIGKYSILDNLIKVIVFILTLTTVLAYVSSFFTPLATSDFTRDFSFSNNSHVYFLIALIGWMPAPMDIPVWHGLWVIEKNKTKSEKVSIKDSLLDFKIGYITTALLALCFMGLGAEVMYTSGQSFSDKAIVFSTELIDLYTKTLGSWARPVIIIAAFTTMFSTAITCLDAFSRILLESFKIYDDTNQLTPKLSLPKLIFFISFGTLILIFFFLKNMKDLVDLATTISFIVAPVFAYMNFKVSKLDEIHQDYRLKSYENILCIIGIVFFVLFTFYYLITKFY